MTMFNNVQYLFWHNQSPKAWKVHEKTAWDELQIEVFAHLASQGELLPAALQCTCPVSRYGASCYHVKVIKVKLPRSPSLDPHGFPGSLCLMCHCIRSWQLMPSNSPCFQTRKAIEPLTGPSTRLAPRLTSRPWTPAKHQNTKHPKSASTASTTALRVRQPEANLSGPTASIIHQKIPSDHGKKKTFVHSNSGGFIVFPLWKPRIYEMLNATYSTINLPYLQLISADYLLGSQPRAPGVDRTAGVPQIYPKTPSDCVWK